MLSVYQKYQTVLVCDHEYLTDSTVCTISYSLDFNRVTVSIYQNPHGQLLIPPKPIYNTNKDIILLNLIRQNFAQHNQEIVRQLVDLFHGRLGRLSSASSQAILSLCPASPLSLDGVHLILLLCF